MAAEADILTPATLVDTVRAGLEVEVATALAWDLSDGCGAKFRLVVVSDGFAGTPPVERQRNVQAALGGAMDKLHALTLNTWTSKQWAKRKDRVFDESGPQQAIWPAEGGEAAVEEVE